MQKQNFYIIGHNPNRIEIAKNYLKLGANALEPDLCYVPDSEDKFYVSHGHDYGTLASDVVSHLPGIISNPFIHDHSLAEYLRLLSIFISIGPPAGCPANQLAMIMFDLKDYQFDINELVKFVWDHFSVFHPGVSILYTVDKPANGLLLKEFDKSISNAGVGIDQHDNADHVQEFFETAKQPNFTYADGTAIIGTHPEYKYIMGAKCKQARIRKEGKRGFSMIYTWVLAREASMRHYLELSIDGIIVDENKVATLKSVLSETRYRDKYTLAVAGDNPFAGNAPHTYLFTVHTRDIASAGSDARIRFVLTNDVSESQDIIIDGGGVSIFEKGGVNHFTMEGLDLGNITSLKIEMLNKGPEARWFPLKILIESMLLPGSIEINFNGNEWVKKGQMITKRIAIG